MDEQIIGAVIDMVISQYGLGGLLMAAFMWFVGKRSDAENQQMVSSAQSLARATEMAAIGQGEIIDMSERITLLSQDVAELRLSDVRKSALIAENERKIAELQRQLQQEREARAEDQRKIADLLAQIKYLENENAKLRGESI